MDSFEGGHSWIYFRFVNRLTEGSNGRVVAERTGGFEYQKLKPEILVCWRRGTKGRLSARFAAVRVRVADGPQQRIRAIGGQHMPGDEAWLIGERRATGEHKYYLSNLPTDTPITVLASTIKARWICEQATSS